MKMENYIRLSMGLVSGLALMMLNNEGVQNTISLVFTLFDPTQTDTIWFSIGVWISRACVFLSFLGIFVVVVFSILIFKKILFNNQI